MNPDTIHAHRCEVCAANGISSVWMHGDDELGNVQKHTCPKCGSTQWKKWLIPVAQVPKLVEHAMKKKDPLQQVIFWTLLAIIVSELFYIAYAVFAKKKAATTAVK